MTKVAGGLRLMTEGKWNKLTEVTLHHTQRDHCENPGRLDHALADGQVALELLLAFGVVVVHHDLSFSSVHLAIGC